ncbi:hypothetical protein [Arcobacter arenosus]|uniref:hypothetical protein n=1 Tax=Arcobacter arenosus TaxID=2576037 RepID=UPI003BABBE2A
MKTKTIIKKFIELEFHAEIDITLLDSRIYTMEVEGKSNLCIEIQVELESFESISDAPLYARSRFLIILGIISFLTQKAFTPIDSNQTQTSIGELSDISNEMFIYEDEDLLHVFKSIMKFIKDEEKNKIRLFYSLIDRWRKALYLEQESEDNMTHDDEAILSYFHILELLSSEYYRTQKEKALSKIDEFSMSFFKEINFLTDQQLQSEMNAKKKILKEILLANFPIKSKILYMLNEQGLLTDRLNSFITQITDDRNSVAHGRQVFQEKLIIPFPPFFPLIKNRKYSLDTIRCLSGRIISLYINAEHMKDDWEYLASQLVPTTNEIKNFIENKEYKYLSNLEFCEGKINDITPEILTNEIFDKKIKLQTALEIFSEFILDFSKTEEETIQLTIITILIVDIAEGELKDKCLEIINFSYENDLIPGFGMRELLYDLELLDFKPKTLRKMIIEDKVR